MNGNKTDPTPISFSLKEIFETVKDLLAPYAIKKKLLFSCETDELTAKVRAEGDPFMLSHILMCLLSNAIKFTIKGSIEVKVTHKRSDAENIELQFSVTDTGTGISETDVEKAINAFATEENGTRTAKNTSAGFGLSLCKRMVKTLGGDMIVTGKTNAGSEFKVSIPYRSVNENSAMRANISEVQNNHSERKKTEVVAAIEMKKNSGVLNNLFSTVSGFSLDQLNRIGNNNEDFVRIMLEKFITTAAKNTENMVSGLANGDFTKLMNAAHKSIPSYHMLGLNHLVKHLQYIERHSREGAEFAELSARLQLVHEETWKVISEIRRCLEFVKDNKAEKIIP